MKKTFSVICIVLIMLLFVGCATITYSPKISLDISPKTIKKTVKVKNLVDKTTSEEKKKPVSGYSVTDSKSLAGDLSIEITNAIIADFNTNGVFSKISKTVDNPDFILKGEIIKFKGKYFPNTLFWITLPIDIIWFFGVPIYKDEIDIEIKLSIYKNSGELIGEYYGKSSSTKSYTIYKNGALGLPAKTNRLFSDVIKQIRKEIIQDSEKLNNY